MVTEAFEECLIDGYCGEVAGEAATSGKADPAAPVAALLHFPLPRPA